ncbi:hypothetical protein C6501_01680 [Candidatus Poribacteria bacterium]|nr:MAG: hypothetical protein C6501_01680 [Candidatus Poribacteria bacterium]
MIFRVLQDVKKLLSSPERWTRGTLARNRKGKTNWQNSNAESFCMTGAVNRIIYDLAIDNKAKVWTDTMAALFDAITADAKEPLYIQRKGGQAMTLYRMIARFNDKSTYNDIIRILDKAIESEEQKFFKTLRMQEKGIGPLPKDLHP